MSFDRPSDPSTDPERRRAKDRRLVEEYLREQKLPEWLLEKQKKDKADGN